MNDLDDGHDGADQDAHHGGEEGDQQGIAEPLQKQQIPVVTDEGLLQSGQKSIDKIHGWLLGTEWSRNDEDGRLRGKPACARAGSP